MQPRPRGAFTTAALTMAAEQGLSTGPKTKHINAKVSPALFKAAAERLGTTSPSEVVAAALASVAVEDELGAWLIRNAGVWRDLPPDVMELIDV